MMLTPGPVKLLVFLLACHRVFTHGDLHVSHEKELIENLIEKYSEIGKEGRPVPHYDDTITVFYGMSLIQILDLDEKNQILSTSVWATYNWNDMYLAWNQSEYGNISTVRVRSEDIWKPDIKLYNYADMRLEEKKESHCVISSNGDVVWKLQAIFRSSCSVDIRYFPFDEQSCYLKFGSWTHDGTKLDLQLLYPDSDGFKMTDYIISNEWDILATTAKRNTKRYECCPEPYYDLTFNLVIRRHAEFYKYILILPCVLLTFLSLVIFWLPPESPAKIQFGMSIFVAFFILLLLLADLTPPQSANIPLIGAYYCLNMALITLSTLLSVVIVNLYFHGPWTTVPRLFRRLMLETFASIFLMTNSLMDKQEWEERKKSAKFHDEERPVTSGVSQTAQDEEGSVTVGVSRTTQDNTSSTSFIKPSDRRRVHFTYDNVGVLQSESQVWPPPNNGLANESDIKDPIQPVPSDLSNPLLPVPSQILDPLQPLLFHYTQLEMEINEIKLMLKILTDRSTEKARKEYLAREWKLVAVVLDRLFFYLYLFTIIVSTVTLFEIRLFNR